MSYRLGINLGFAVNKYSEPEVWTELVAHELGLNYVQFVADLLNPFWDQDYINSQKNRINRSCMSNHISIESIFTSSFTRVNHLMSPDSDARKMWYKWFEKFIEMGSDFGAKNIGSHFGILTFGCYNDVHKREFIIDEAIKSWQMLSIRAKELGYSELIYEPMSVDREMGNTIKRAKELMDKVNENSAIPMKLCLDVGHAPDPSERDPYVWVESLGKYSSVIHLQQTDINKSNHSPFTDDYNRTGIIERNKLINSIMKSGCEDALLAFEISHREHFDFEQRILSDLKKSVEYFREVI